MQIFEINTNGVAAESFGNEVVLINLLRGNYYSFRDPVAISSLPNLR